MRGTVIFYGNLACASAYLAAGASEIFALIGGILFLGLAIATLILFKGE